VGRAAVPAVDARAIFARATACARIFFKGKGSCPAPFDSHGAPLDSAGA